jgi:hypothetical protein
MVGTVPAVAVGAAAVAEADGATVTAAVTAGVGIVIAGAEHAATAMRTKARIDGRRTARIAVIVLMRAGSSALDLSGYVVATGVG